MESYAHQIYTQTYPSTLPSVESLALSAPGSTTTPSTTITPSSSLPSPTMTMYPRTTTAATTTVAESLHSLATSILPIPSSLSTAQVPTPAQSQSPVSHSVFPSISVPNSSSVSSSVATSTANSLPTPTPTTASVSSSVSSLLHSRDSASINNNNNNNTTNGTWPAPSPREDYDAPDNYSFQQQQHHQHQHQHQHQQHPTHPSIVLPAPHHIHRPSTSTSSSSSSATATATSPTQVPTNYPTVSPRASWSTGPTNSAYDRLKASPFSQNQNIFTRTEYSPRYSGSLYSGGNGYGPSNGSPTASSPLGAQRSSYSDDGIFGTESNGGVVTAGVESGDGVEGDNKEKVEEPYAQLIYRAFMSAPNHALTLQEIYQWFRENTDKPRSGGKGWQNSIRHNLSMNGAFVKKDRKPGTESPSGYPLPSTDCKKSTVWVLENWAVEKGVQSTTRYRKDNSARRAVSVSMAPASHIFSSSCLAGTSSVSGAHTHQGMSSRAISGRKGGCATSNNARIRKREQFAVMNRYGGYPAAHSHNPHHHPNNPHGGHHPAHQQPHIPVHYSGSGSGAAYGGAGAGGGNGGYFYGYEAATGSAGQPGGQQMGMQALMPYAAAGYQGGQAAGPQHGFEYVGAEYPAGFANEGGPYY